MSTLSDTLPNNSESEETPVKWWVILIILLAVIVMSVMVVFVSKAYSKKRGNAIKSQINQDLAT